jgi:hypothetical protein
MARATQRTDLAPHALPLGDSPSLAVAGPGQNARVPLHEDRRLPEGVRVALVQLPVRPLVPLTQRQIEVIRALRA